MRLFCQATTFPPPRGNHAAFRRQLRVRRRGRLWLCRCMRITVQTPTTNGLGSVVMALASWQRDGIPVQLHPGDLGWQWRFGADVLADSLRVWSRDEEIVAIGFVDRAVVVDEAAVIRMALAPSVDQNDDVARVLVRDLEDSSTGLLPAGSATVEARFGQAFRSLLEAHGWLPDEPWTPLHRDLTHAVEDCAMRVETVGPSHVEERVAVQGAAFARSTFTVDRWHTMTAGIPYQQARCLVGYDDEGVAVAAVTVWSAGPRRPGLLEPMECIGTTVDAGTVRRSRSRRLPPSARWVLRAQSSPPRPRTREPSPPTRQLASTPLPTSPISSGLPNPSPSRAIRQIWTRLRCPFAVQWRRWVTSSRVV